MIRIFGIQKKVFYFIIDNLNSNLETDVVTTDQILNVVNCSPDTLKVLIGRLYKKNLLIKNQTSQRFYYLMNATENKSALDYYYWNNKLLYLNTNKPYSDDFERNFQNAVILSNNNSDIRKALKIFYLRNIPRFSKETQALVISK